MEGPADLVQPARTLFRQPTVLWHRGKERHPEKFMSLQSLVLMGDGQPGLVRTLESSEHVPYYFSMATHELSWSVFLREPTSVEQWLDKGDVVLKRRDGESLRLCRLSRSENERQAIASAVRLLWVPLESDRSRDLGQLVADRLPWTRFLPEADRTRFAKDFLGHLEACADLGDFTALGRLLEEWKNTATAFAEGLGRELTRPVKDVGGRVHRPER